MQNSSLEHAHTQNRLRKRRLQFQGKRRAWEPPPFIKIGKIVLYDVVDLDEWLASCRRRSTSDPVQALDTTAERLHHRHSRPPK